MGKRLMLAAMVNPRTQEDGFFDGMDLDMVLRLAIKHHPEEGPNPKPAPGLSDVAPLRRTSRPVIISSGVLKKGGTRHKPLRGRLLHLLALKPYKKPELILSCKNGLSQSDKDSLDSLLQQVANLNGKDNTFTLKDSLFKEIQKDWPGYTEGDQQLLKRILSRKLTQNTSTPPPESPPKEQADSSPSQKRPAAEFIDPLVSKKPRISHLMSKVAAGTVNGKLISSIGKEAGGTQAAVTGSVSDSGTTSGSQLPLLDIPRPFDALSDVSNDSSHNGRDCDSQEAAVSKRLSQPSSVALGSAVLTASNTGPSSPGCSSLCGLPDNSTSSLHIKSRKKSKKHKDKGKTKDKEVAREKKQEQEVRDRPEPHQICELGSTPANLKSSSVPEKSTDQNGLCNSPSVPSPTPEVSDYLMKYTAISSQEQRQRYKNDFNAEYTEYRCLHAQIEGVTWQFTVLDNELKQLKQGTDKYKTIHNQIIKEYHQIKKDNPNYTKDKNRCEYLHNKLAHIKRLIAEFDQQHL
ncbi:RNA polymerase II elongation factor ELL-like [Thalassophryne amazonica]|uniref:RNA polymerase II elongation factor ELL-like n=1 Tax=Thalassophryne amazonica TaxID=390379 RepID=UPI0014717FCF|nr:RNA polymerase II elongation factor ELL-like [Thalassophryne amazonica]